MQTGRDVAESHREDAAGRDVAELLTCRDAGADWQGRGRGRRGGAAAGSEVVQHHREENTGKDASKEEQLRDACRA